MTRQINLADAVGYQVLLDSDDIPARLVCPNGDHLMLGGAYPAYGFDDPYINVDNAQLGWYLDTTGCVNLNGVNLNGMWAYDLVFADNPNLEYINFGDNIWSIWLMTLRNLPSYSGPLNLSGANRFGTLIIENCPQCSEVDVSGSTLAVLDLSTNTGIKIVHCGNSSMTTLNILGCSLLDVLDAQGNVGMTALDVSQNPALSELYVDGSAITSIDLSQNPALEYLGVGNTPLTTLDITHNSQLTSVNLQQCSLTQAAIDGILTALDGFGLTGGILALEGGTNAAPTGAGATAAANLIGKGWTVTTN